MNKRASDEPRATPSERGEVGESAKAMLEEEKRMARDAASQAAEAGKERLESGASQAAESMDHIAEAVGTAASRLGEMEHEGLADYANRLSGWLSDMSGKLRNKSVDEIADEIRHLAERNPALFILGSVAVGVGLSRFAKASSHRQAGDGGRREWSERGEAEWSTRAGDTRDPGGDSEWTQRVAEEEYEPYDPSRGREGDGRTGERAPDRPTTPDSSGGSGL